ncbi:hypothetical protein JXR93_00395 [bacterium]|nr:hypothetical protein [bacterium]
MRIVPIYLFIISLLFWSCSDTSGGGTSTVDFTKMEILAEQCQDNQDNDGDGKTDCDDDGCKGFVFCQEVVEPEKTEDTAALCRDQLDNDDDGKTDCDDEDCQGFVFCVVSEVENTSVLCQDGRDNDDDGKTDCDDEECQGFVFCNEEALENTAYLCQDGLDNDGDTKADCEDEDCQVFLFCASGAEDSVTLCKDGIDNDGDSKIDCLDPDCQGFTFCTQITAENTSTMCKDGVDNDRDGRADCQDSDCSGFTFCQAAVENTAVLCQDTLDNDGDTKADCEDTDCQGFTFCQDVLENTAVACQDGDDNDFDGLADCEDPDCQGFTFCQAVLENTAVACQDGDDNDSDGLADCEDPDCQGFVFCSTVIREDSYTLCQDGIDNDNDGLVDCDDEDCWPLFLCQVYNGVPIMDSWGATWDSLERGKKTWDEAKEICESLGGRLPTATEIFRNNATTGTGDIGQTNNTEYLWTLLSEYSTDHRVLLRVSDGVVTNSLKTGKYAFRCIWPKDDNSGFDEDRCNRTPEGECFEYDKHYNIDTIDRPALTYSAAMEECNFYGASIPVFSEWSEAIHQNIDNGVNAWNWVAESIYWYNQGTGSPVVRWDSLTNTKNWTANNTNFSLSAHTTRYNFRCIGLKNQNDFSEPLSTNCNGGCFENSNRASKILSDSTDREALTYPQAIEICRDLGGDLPNAREFSENVSSGWENGTNNWMFVADHLYWYSNGYGVSILRWNGTGNRHWYYTWNGTSNISAMTSNYRFRCAWFQPKPETPECGENEVLKESENGFECQTKISGGSNGNAYGSEKIDPWGNAWDGVQRAQVTFDEAKASCESLGGRLPTISELYRVNAANPIETTDVATASSTSYLWSLTDTYAVNSKMTLRLSDGVTSRSLTTVQVPYRCIWPATNNDILVGNNCMGNSTSPCFEVGDIIADSYDRASVDYTAALEDCLSSGGHLMDSRTFINLVQQGLPNGSNNYNWINEAAYWYSGNYGLHVVRWSGIQTGWSGASGPQGVTLSTSSYPYRCYYTKRLK